LTKSKRSKDFPLILKAQKNPRYFSALYEKYFKEIFLFILKKTSDESLTGELTSNVFLKAILNLSKYQDRGFPFSSWLYRIASNEINKHYRDNKKVQEVAIQEKDAITFLAEIDSNDNSSDITKLMDCLSDLREDQSNIIELRYFDKMSFNEIGKVLGITGNNAKIKLYRAVDRLKQIFHNQR
tara:strand:- start:473 stop:1021 length:549 start_codon:yes stop_codon:yes gene_type:complete